MTSKQCDDRYEKDLIVAIATGAHGIGATTAGALAESYDTLSEFLKASPADLAKLSIKRASGLKPILSAQQVAALVIVKKEIPQGLGIRETWIFKLARDFAAAQVATLKAMHLDDLDINPLLIEALDLNEPKDILSFVLYQTITRSIVTGWGTCVEKMVKYAGCEANDARDAANRGVNFDLKKTVAGVDYYIQIKSGPNTMNVGMVEHLNSTIAKLPSGKKAFLGMTYGTRSRISPQIMGNLKNPHQSTKIGRELWDFVAEESNYHRKVMSAISDATHGLIKDKFIDMVDAKIDELVAEWAVKYKDQSLNEILEHYI